MILLALAVQLLFALSAAAAIAVLIVSLRRAAAAYGMLDAALRQCDSLPPVRARSGGIALLPARPRLPGAAAMPALPVRARPVLLAAA